MLLCFPSLWKRAENAWALLSASETKMVPLPANCSPGRLGLRLCVLGPIIGGNSNTGDGAKRGDTENDEPLSDTSDGAPSREPARDISDAAGEGRECSEGRQ